LGQAFIAAKTRACQDSTQLLPYGIVAVLAGAAMIALAIRVRCETRGHIASKQMFGFSILYLFLLFAMLLVDRMATGLFAPLWAHLPAGA